MDPTERSYQLLREYASGQRVYDLELCSDASVYIVFCPQGSNNGGATKAPRVKLPTLKATTEHLHISNDSSSQSKFQRNTTLIQLVRE
ncbi:hypothetical protein JHK85_007462 [Glycine max]|nr:hypothetical protein JHK85_007462 [Glycine max]